MVWGIQCLAGVVLAVTLSTASGFAVPRIFQKSHLEDGATALHELFRLARGTAEVNSNSANGDAEDEGCIPLYQCWYRPGMSSLIEHISSFDFVDLTESLQTTCPGFDVSSCKVGDCPDTGSQTSFRIGITVADWACSRQEDFVNSLGCWADPFQEQLTSCIRTSPRMQLRTCFAHTIRGLSSSCTPQDQDFFIEFSSFVLDEHERAYTG